jgi:hypothetical protein
MKMQEGEMVKVIPNGYMLNSQGHLVPVECVKEIDKLRDSLVREIAAKASEVSKVLSSFKDKAMEDIDAFVSLSAEKYGVTLGGRKGNLQLITYDGEFRIIVAISDNLTFDERLHAAKELIDQCVREWSENSRPELKALVFDAFNVDKTGKVDTKRVLGLRRLDIDDARWQNAMKIIGESLQVAGSKSYIRVYKRQEDGEYKQINLDIAAI